MILSSRIGKIGIGLYLGLWKVFAKNKETVVIYGFILLLWIFRVVMAIVCPCPPESNVWMSYGQLGGSVILMFLLLFPFIRIAVAMRESKKGGIWTNYDLPKYLSNFPYFTGFSAYSLVKWYVFSLIFALMR